MKTDWKKVSKSAGYISLKAAYIKDVQKASHEVRKGLRPLRDKEEYRGYFKKAIGFAMFYSNKWEMPIDVILNFWESERDYWWLSFYQKGNLSRLKPNL